MIIKTLFDTKKALLCLALCVLTAFCANAFGASRLANLDVRTPLGSPSSLAGSLDGTGNAARFETPSSVVFNNPGAVPTTMYVADTYSNKIRAVNLATNAVTTLAGSGTAGWADGTGANARFNKPTGITIDSTSSNLYVADKDNGAIRKINIASGAVTTVIGKNCSTGPTTQNNLAADGGCYATLNPDAALSYLPGTGVNASFATPYHLIMSYASPCSSTSGCLWVTDFVGTLSVVDLSASPAAMSMAAAIDPNGNAVFACTSSGGVRILLFPTNFRHRAGLQRESARFTAIRPSYLELYARRHPVFPRFLLRHRWVGA